MHRLPTTGQRRPARRLLVAAAVLALGPATASCASGDDEATPPESGDSALSGYTVDPPESVAAVALPGTAGEGDVAMAAPAGGLRLVYFGYTSCPDVCPTTMSDIRRALSELPEKDRERVSVAMVTVDPARDTPERLTDYVRNFVADGIALRTEDPDLLRSAADAFGADYGVTTAEDGEVEVSHTADLYAVDDQGTVLVRWPFGTDYQSLASDFGTLLGDGSAG
jgi:protein SCO1/2